MKIFIDTDLAISFLSNRKDPLSLQAKELFPKLVAETEDIYLTVFNYAELLRGAYLSSRVAQNIRIVEEFVKRFSIIPFSGDAIEKYVKIYAELKHKGESIGDFDELIASIVLANAGALFTHNISHFQRIALLDINDWALDDCISSGIDDLSADVDKYLYK